MIKNLKNKILLCLFCLTFVSYSALATVYSVPENNSRIIGEDIIHQVVKGDFFQLLAEKYNVGFLALMAANPGVDPFLAKVGSEVIIPKKMLLPYIKKQGIVVNLAELRLYYFEEESIEGASFEEQNIADENTEDSNSANNQPNKIARIHVFPIGIGRQGLSTPQTVSFISEKRKDPTWRPTQEMRARYLKEHGRTMAKEFPPGPNNPFGKYALRIGHSEYLLHGSNQRFGIGMRASSGCIRMYDDDIKWLYENIAVNTPISIINQPIKMAYETTKLRLIEVHQPLSSEEPAMPANELPNSSTKIIIPEAVQRFIGSQAQHIKQTEAVLTQASGLVSELRY